MALTAYRRKRNFTATSEPRGGKPKQQRGFSFVVQKHDATRLHYDFRLELDGTLKSWAVTKGPSLVPGDKRLAVHVEDHPLEYGDFEGTIPKGEYGGGTVIVWDRGTWEPINDPRKGYSKGKLDFALAGEKLRGRWHLVRINGRPREKKQNWLLIKGDDEGARAASDPDILEERPESVKTGRTIAEVQYEQPGWSSKTGRIKRKPIIDPKKIAGARKSPFPGFIAPELATLKTTPPVGAGWLHEIKFDGYRLQAQIKSGKVSLLTRSGLDWTAKFGKAVIGALERLPTSEAIIDGEVVVENDVGASDFSALQSALSEGNTGAFTFFAFDLLYLDGHDLRGAPLEARKNALEQVMHGAEKALRYSGHFQESGEMILRHACRLSLEGIVSKKRNAPYRSDRSPDWIKTKCSERQEFVVAGYVPSSTSRKAIGSLVLGFYERGKLIHAGRVGTGFTVRAAEDLYQRLEKIRASDSPFAARLPRDQVRDVRFVSPEMVAEVEFRSWTSDDLLRHASFRGIRDDKPSQEIVRESRGTPPKSRLPKPSVSLTHPDRIYWPDKGVTKEGLADYYTAVWRYIAPFVVGRPLSLLRCPAGVTGQCFFQKHAWKGLNKSIKLAHDPKDPSDEPIITIDSLDGLIGLVQAAVLEIHPWGSTIADIERPDIIIMDLDPGEGVAWAEVINAARDVRRRLKHAGLDSFVKTSGGKGLHVVSPVRPQADWQAVKEFTGRIASQMAGDEPDRYVDTITKSKRKGKILVDYLRNGRGATAIAPYSTRARPGAAVSMPLAWEELEDGIGPAYFTVENAVNRLNALVTDPWGDFRKKEKPIDIEKQTAQRRSAA